ncbi:hypothetical protein [Erythrobacter sp. EC-HK427]|uniref:hypothetical protein n=1 Tax=Erythrobacter sp. EC-HK427 TaxID=2038396 RepID=UPI0012562B7D|nr:hypothetical protein [Erythrobacter sp. EC-HK427]VVS98614.1 conserved hypothetical protein [Erythrobacter sp. EC-HK427]
MNSLEEIGGTGEVARLFPVLAETSKEGRTLSILLASLIGVPEFANSMLKPIGRAVGKRTVVEAYTEVCFAKSQEGKCRPDGLIVVRTGHKIWRALVEAKVGNSNLTSEQVSSYLRLAKETGIDAVITISNEYTSGPDHHPLSIDKRLTKKVDLFHFSWFDFLTALNLLSEGEDVDDPEKQFLLNELERFLIHPSAGLQRFTSMSDAWGKVLDRLRSGLALSKTSSEVCDVVTNWHSELNDLCLLLTRKTGSIVEVKLPNKLKGNADFRLQADCNALAQTNVLRAQLQVPDAAATLDLEADVSSRTIRVESIVNAPKDRVRQSSRLNWLLRQFEGDLDQRLRLQSHWPGKAPVIETSLQEAASEPSAHSHPDSSMLPHKFAVAMRMEDGRKFAGRKTFISELEEVVLAFYEHGLSHLQAWQPPAPTLRRAVEEAEETEED